MEKKSKIKNIALGVGKSAKGLIDNAVSAIDQNDDGKFDLADVKEIKDRTKYELDLKTLKPLFLEDLESLEFSLPKFIRVVDRDKKRASSEACIGSIGYESDQNDLYIINIFKDSIDAFGLTFFPDTDSEFYYVNPISRDNYIALDKYFSYIKTARIGELQRIAQDLGAKYFKITCMEEQISFTKNKKKVSAKALKNTATLSSENQENEYTVVNVAVENSFPGCLPKRPTLSYWQNDQNINSLIDMRLNENSPLTKQTFLLKMKDSNSINTKDALKIDAVLKGLKCQGNTTLSNEVSNELRRCLEYTVEF